MNHLRKSYSYGDLVMRDLPRSDSGAVLSRVDEEGRDSTDTNGKISLFYFTSRLLTEQYR